METVRHAERVQYIINVISEALVQNDEKSVAWKAFLDNLIHEAHDGTN